LPGVTRLRGLWARQLEIRNGHQIEKNAEEEKLDRAVIDGLGLSVEETMTYLLREAPGFDEFERWIINKNGGVVDELRIEKINCFTEKIPYSKKLNESIREIEEADPVLTDTDLKFWEEHGYLIVRNAITCQEAHQAENAVWQFMGMSPDDPETWYVRQANKGIMTEFYHHPTLNANRRSIRVHKAFAQIWQTADLWSTTDRAGFNPPEISTWKFPGPRLHWDMNLAPPYNFGVQGLLYLCDTPAGQGAFSCVPGFHKKLEDWLADLPDDANPRAIDLDNEAIPIAGNAGDLIIWHQFLPHGSSPNRGCYPRIVQYLTMYPFYWENDAEWK
jgi:hypothetical protein